jgi:hypothetical protein
VGKGNRSTYSSFSPDFGCLRRIRIEDGEDAFISFHVRSETGEWPFSQGAKISPRRREPKKDVVAAHQKTCFVNGSQGDLAILDPMVIRSGNVTTRRVLLDGWFKLILEIPVRSRLIVASFEIYSQSKPRIV